MLEARVEPRRIGRYTLLAKLASGGMATVFLAQSHGELGFQRLCAVKIIHPHLLDQPEFLARFLHEGKVASGIRHPNVVAVLDVGQAGDTPYLVLDYVRGASLADLMKRAEELGEPASLEVACTIVREVLEGLHAVHTATDEQGAALGLIHRDVSHDNILLSTDGVTYVTDLGIARARGVALTRATGLLGKAGYISPEQLAKEPLTNKVDIFAAGVVLWELLTQKRLFVDLESELPMLTGTFVLEPPSRSNPRVPAALDGLVARMLARNPDDRPRSAGAAAQEIGRIVPSATRGEISEWVQSLAEARLERLDAILRDAKQSVPPPADSSNPYTMPTPGSYLGVQGNSGPALALVPGSGGVGRTSQASGVNHTSHASGVAFPTTGSANVESGAHPRAGVSDSFPSKRSGAGRKVAGILGFVALAALGGAAFRLGLVRRAIVTPAPSSAARDTSSGVAPSPTSIAPATSGGTLPLTTPSATATLPPPSSASATGTTTPASATGMTTPASATGTTTPASATGTRATTARPGNHGSPPRGRQPPATSPPPTASAPPAPPTATVGPASERL